MGTIKVGLKNPKEFKPGGWTTASEQPVIGESEKSALLESIRRMPREKWVSAMRSAGLNDEADECERLLAEEHLRELSLKARTERLAEIKAMPEEEQLALLVEEGFDEEAKELSERLAVVSEEEGAGTGDENVGTESPVGGGLAELSDGDEGKKNEAAPKKRGRRAKNAKK